MSFFRATYAKAGGIAFLGELGAHILVLASGFRLADLPFWADWLFFILGGYSTIGFIVFWDRLVWRCGDKFVTQLTQLPAAFIDLRHDLIQAEGRPTD